MATPVAVYTGSGLTRSPEISSPDDIQVVLSAVHGRLDPTARGGSAQSESRVVDAPSTRKALLVFRCRRVQRRMGEAPSWSERVHAPQLYRGTHNDQSSNSRRNHDWREGCRYATRLQCFQVCIEGMHRGGRRCTACFCFSKFLGDMMFHILVFHNMKGRRPLGVRGANR